MLYERRKPTAPIRSSSEHLPNPARAQRRRKSNGRASRRRKSKSQLRRSRGLQQRNRAQCHECEELRQAVMTTAMSRWWLWAAVRLLVGSDPMPCMRSGGGTGATCSARGHDRECCQNYPQRIVCLDRGADRSLVSTRPQHSNRRHLRLTVRLLRRAGKKPKGYRHSPARTG